jgi:uncharacterized phiE125 gp8 family phage protein
MMYNYRTGDSLTGTWTANLFPHDTEIVSGPNQYSLTTAEVKEFLRINDNYDDLYIDLLIGAVQEQVERYMGLDTTLRTRQSYWMRTAGTIRLPYGPHGFVASVVAQDDDGTQTTLNEGTDYNVIGMRFLDVRLLNPTGSQILVSYTSGHSTVPPAIKGAMLQEISLQYKNRQDPNTPARTSVNNLTIESRHLLASYLRLDL